MTDSPDTNKDDAGSTKADAKPEIKDIRFSEEDAKRLEQLIATSKEKPDTTKPDEDKGSEELVKLQAEIKKMKDDRRKDLLARLGKKDAKKYKDKSNEQLEMLVEYLTDNPPKSGAISRYPGSTKDDEKEDKDSQMRAAGIIGGLDAKTGKWK